MKSQQNKSQPSEPCITVKIGQSEPFKTPLSKEKILELHWLYLAPDIYGARWEARFKQN